MEAIGTRELVLSADLATERRWPAWVPVAREDGVVGALAVPIDVEEEVIGALTLYAGTASQFTPDVGLTAMLVAEQAGLLLAGVLDRGRLTGLAEELTEALGAGEVVNRAIGIVMAQRSCPAQTALDVLLDAASQVNLPLPVVAARLVESIGRRAT
jgi:GAF domain-containing protein